MKKYQLIKSIAILPVMLLTLALFATGCETRIRMTFPHPKK